MACFVFWVFRKSILASTKASTKRETAHICNRTFLFFFTLVMEQLLVQVQRMEQLLVRVQRMEQLLVRVQRMEQARMEYL